MNRWILAFLCLSSFSHPAIAAEPLVERYISLYFRSEAALEDFDRELERAEPGFLLQSRSYRELLVLRQKMKETAHSLLSLPEERLQSEDPAALPALEHLSHQMISHGRKMERNLLPLSDRLRHQEAFASRLEENKIRARLNEALESEIRKGVRDLALGLLPTSARVRPAPGSEGNMSGYRFPQDTWALTYDDGPSPTHTLSILALLERYSAKATFFWLAQNLPQNRAVVEKVKAAGMALANHSYTHANLPKVSAAALRKEIVESTRLQTEIYGQKPLFFRCPYGAGLNISRIRQLIADTGMIHVFWNVDSLDWQDKNPESVLARVKKQMAAEKKGVILFHDIHPQTVEATRLLLEDARKSPGLRWVTMPEALRLVNGS